MRVCYFGAYDRSYARNKVLMKGLRENGCEVLECHNAHPLKALRLPLLARKYLSMARHVDVIVVGACGHTYVPLAKLLARATGKPVILDAFVSQYDTVIKDRKQFKDRSWRAKYYYALDKVSASLADIVLLDTEQHVDYFCETFRLPREKFRPILVGADTDLFRPRPPRPRDNAFLVTFIGTFIPLQGVQYVIQAAQLLRDYSWVRFLLVGSGQTFGEARRLAVDLNIPNLSFIGQLPIEQLPQRLAEADVCLGIFGDTEKAQRVIPNKVYQAMAMGKPVITGDTPASRPYLIHRENAMLVPVADPSAIAGAVVDLIEDPSLRERIARNGLQTFQAVATPQTLGAELTAICHELLRASGKANRHKGLNGWRT